MYLLGADGVPYHDDGGKWVKLPGKGENITVDADGVPWLTNDKRKSSRWFPDDAIGVGATRAMCARPAIQIAVPGRATTVSLSCRRNNA